MSISMTQTVPSVNWTETKNFPIVCDRLKNFPIQIINQFMLNGLSHPYQLDKSIFNFRVVR